jgi:RNA polymerase sigma factor (sigma-70 family)
VTHDIGEPIVAVIDDDAAVRTALVRLFRSTGLQADPFESCEAFLAAPPGRQPSCLVLDVSLPGLDGPALQRRLSADRNPPPIVFLTGHGDIPMSVRAMKDGAVDFLTKPATEAALLAAVGAALDRARASEETARVSAVFEERLATLTSREREVFRHVIAGKPNKTIAADIGTSEKTVKVHRGRVMAKMQAQSVAQLVRMAEATGVEPAI